MEALCPNVKSDSLDNCLFYFFKRNLVLINNATPKRSLNWVTHSATLKPTTGTVNLHVSAIKIYREEAVGLKSSNYTLKLWFLWILCEIWGNFLKIWYFVNNCLIKVWIWKSFRTYVTHIIVILYSTSRFVSTESFFRFPFLILRFLP